MRLRLLLLLSCRVSRLHEVYNPTIALNKNTLKR